MPKSNNARTDLYFILLGEQWAACSFKNARRQGPSTIDGKFFISNSRPIWQYREAKIIRDTPSSELTRSYINDAAGSLEEINRLRR